MSPKRIQRKRTKGWRMPAGAVYVGRPSRWGNPIELPAGAMPEQRAAAVRDFEKYALWKIGISEAERDAMIPALRGKDLACYCRLDQPCHADVWLKLANA
jgi:hypothetical protein